MIKVNLHPKLNTAGEWCHCGSILWSTYNWERKREDRKERGREREKKRGGKIKRESLYMNELEKLRGQKEREKEKERKMGEKSNTESEVEEGESDWGAYRHEMTAAGCLREREAPAPPLAPCQAQHHVHPPHSLTHPPSLSTGCHRATRCGYTLPPPLAGPPLCSQHHEKER